MNKHDYVGIVIYKCLVLHATNVINERRESKIAILTFIDGKLRAWT